MTMRLVLVEDENLAARRLQKMVGRILEAVPHTFVRCATPEEGLDAIAENPDLILLDLNLGVLNAMEWVRARKIPPENTIIISADTRYAEEAFELGIFAYVYKPVEESTLQNHIVRFLEKRNEAI